MIETIGRVRLNKQWYCGEDRYSDGDATEERLMRIIQEEPSTEYAKIALREGSWPLLYHLSPVRENIIRWIPFKPGASVLELGAGCGAVTGALLNRGLKVCAVDLSLRRCRINAERHRDSGELEIIVGAMEEVLCGIGRKFDYVLLIGVLEYAAVYSDDSRPQAHMLKCIREVMAPDGELYVAIENKVGMKYLAGSREDHTGRFFESIEGYPHQDGPLTFSRGELAELFRTCGFSGEFYYPYPDYKFPIKVFSDAWLPAPGELNRNWQCFDADRLQLFDECRAFDTAIRAGLFPEVANAFLARLWLSEAGERPLAGRVLFVKSSIERKPCYQHHTLILENEGKCFVRKEAVSPEGRAHLMGMAENRSALADGLDTEGDIVIAPCTLNDDETVDFPFYAHKTLRDLLGESREDVEAFLERILDFRKALTRAYGVSAFEESESFRAFFGDAGAGLQGDALNVTDLDLNFDNVFIDEEGRYIIVDYEWVFPFKAPLSFVLYRALLVNQDMANFAEEDRERVWAALGMDAALRKTYFEMELCFQRHVSGEDYKLEAFKNCSIDSMDACIDLDRLLDAVHAVRRLSADVEAIKEAYAKQAEASRELTRQRDEYRTALDEQNEASRELTRQRDEYRTALDEQSEASRELTRQRDEYHAAYDELWKRTEIAERDLEKTRAELAELIRKHTPFWRR